MTFKNVLLAVDINDQQNWKRPLQVALEMAGDTPLHIMTVVPDFGMSIVGGFFPKDFEKDAMGKAQEALHEWTTEHLPKGARAQHILGHGVVYEEILRVAREIKADLIVMGSHRPKAEDFFLGPNAARVVRHAGCSVTVVRD